MMICYDPVFGIATGSSSCRPFAFHYYDGCFGDRIDTPSRCAWVVPGTWPVWAL